MRSPADWTYIYIYWRRLGDFEPSFCFVILVPLRWSQVLELSGIGCGPSAYRNRVRLDTHGPRTTAYTCVRPVTRKNNLQATAARGCTVPNEGPIAGRTHARELQGVYTSPRREPGVSGPLGTATTIGFGAWSRGNLKIVDAGVLVDQKSSVSDERSRV